MDKFISTENGLTTLIAGILLILCLHLLFALGRFVWEMYKKKSELSEKSVEKLIAAMDMNTRAVEKLDARISEVEKDLSEIPKFKNDLRRLFTAIKLMAGDQWPKIRQEIMDDGIPGV